MSVRAWALCFGRNNCPHRTNCARAHYPDGTRPQFGDLSLSCAEIETGTKEKHYIHFLDARKLNRKAEA
jgi:hypothetical protein